MIQVSNLGRTVEGHVLDCNKKELIRLLKNYDSKLYLKWNPNKNKGYGMWEIRRTPNEKTAVYECDYRGAKIFSLKAVENDLINHVLDVPYLNYRVMNRIKEMDAWVNKRLIEDMDYQAEKNLIASELKAEADRKYMIKHNKKYFGQLKQLVQDGYNPAYFFNGKYTK